MSVTHGGGLRGGVRAAGVFAVCSNLGQFKCQASSRFIGEKEKVYARWDKGDSPYKTSKRASVTGVGKSTSTASLTIFSSWVKSDVTDANAYNAARSAWISTRPSPAGWPDVPGGQSSYNTACR